jgi:hypothetical protein
VCVVLLAHFVKSLLLQQRTETETQTVKQYKGLRDAFKTIYREEGFRAFYKGLAARLMYVSPAGSLSPSRFCSPL